jgi:nucleotide-binding universal stress UspA family protein
LQTANELKFLEGAEVRIAHAFVAVGKGKMYIADASPERIAAYIDEEKRRTDADLAAFLSEAGFVDRAWRRDLWEGTATEVISSAVETLGPDLVVVGTHGRSGIAKIFLGSVSESLLRTLDADILAVPPAC